MRINFESASNVPRYSDDTLYTTDPSLNLADTYDVGNCNVISTTTGDFGNIVP